VACPDDDVKGIIAMGTPMLAEDRAYGYEFLARCTKPKLFCSGDRDQFASPESLAQVVASAADPKQLVFIPNADHFFAGHLAEMRHALEQWLQSTLQL